VKFLISAIAIFYFWWCWDLNSGPHACSTAGATPPALRSECFWWDWHSNSRHCACKAGDLPTVQFGLLTLKMGFLNYWPGLASNHNPPVTGTQQDWRFCCYGLSLFISLCRHRNARHRFSHSAMTVLSLKVESTRSPGACVAPPRFRSSIYIRSRQ
jgi:hypothetical protein